MDNNILVKNLCKQFEDFSLDNVSFKVPKGRIVGFIGENGAGKSTTINLILNELNKDSGQIQVFGIDHTIPTVKDNIGVVFDECNFHDVFTATDIEKILKGIYKTWDSNLFLQYLKKFKIPTKKKIGAFSKGMKMKLSIICAMAHRPQLLILDEATTGLDPIVRDEVLDLFLEFIQDEDCSIFFSSHITSDIQKIADYVILIHQGKIIFEEQKDNLVYNYGVAKCGKEKFAQLSTDDYIIHRTTNMSVECLVHNKEAFKRKYKNIIVDNATLEDIILLYVKVIPVQKITGKVLLSMNSELYEKDAPVLSREDAIAVLNTPNEELDALIDRAKSLRYKYKGNRVSIHILTNARSGNCSQDCAYCAQSCRSTADIDKYKWVDEEKLYQDNDFVNDYHLSRHCIGLSGMKFTDKEIEELARRIRKMKEHGTHLCCSIGFLTEKQARMLKEAGLDRINHNLNSSRSYYHNICSTHDRCFKYPE